MSIGGIIFGCMGHLGMKHQSNIYRYLRLAERILDNEHGCDSSGEVA